MLYRDEWPGSVQLVGVDARGTRALLRMESQRPRRVALDSIDLRAGVRADRWESRSAGREARSAYAFRSFGGRFEDDLRRFAGLLRWASPATAHGVLGSPTVTSTADGASIVFGAAPGDGSDGDWLYLLGSGRAGRRRLDPGLRASYAPAFSPDGAHLSFWACAASPCSYAVYVGRLGQPAARVALSGVTRPPVWSVAGDRLFAVSHRDAQGDCLYAIGSEAPRVAREVRCVKGLSEVEFVQDPTGATGVISGFHGDAGDPTYSYQWIRLDDGADLGRREVHHASGAGALGPTGVLAIPMQRGDLGLVDLASRRDVLIPSRTSWFFGLETTRWTEDGRLVVLRRGDSRGFELVAVRAIDGAEGGEREHVELGGGGAATRGRPARPAPGPAPRSTEPVELGEGRAPPPEREPVELSP